MRPQAAAAISGGPSGAPNAPAKQSPKLGILGISPKPMPIASFHSAESEKEIKEFKEIKDVQSSGDSEEQGPIPKESAEESKQPSEDQQKSPEELSLEYQKQLIAMLDAQTRLLKQQSEALERRAAAESAPARNFKVVQNLGALQKFTPEMAHRTPFHLWYPQFAREMSALRCDESTVILNLQYWVDKRCWQNWSEFLDKSESTSLQYLLDRLTDRYPDRTTYIRRQEQFREVKQEGDDVLAYSELKKHHFQLAYPNSHINEEFFFHWEQGLYRDFRIRLVEEGVVDYAEALELCRKWEHALKVVDGTYGNFGSSPKSESPRSSQVASTYNAVQPQNRDVCREFVKKGFCRFGMACRFEHPAKVFPAGVESTAITSGKAVEQEFSVLANTASDPHAPCTRSNCADRPTHAWTRCTQPGKPCPRCNSFYHMKHFCPTAVCAKCNQMGHSEFVCQNWSGQSILSKK